MLHANLPEGIQIASGSHRIVRTDKYDIRVLQVFIILSAVQELPVDHTVIVARAFCQVPLAGHLHFDVIRRAAAILGIDIHPDALAQIIVLHCLLPVDLLNMVDLHIEDPLQQFADQWFLPHHPAEHEIIHDRQILQILETHARSLPLIPGPALSMLCDASVADLPHTASPLSHALFPCCYRIPHLACFSQRN